MTFDKEVLEQDIPGVEYKEPRTLGDLPSGDAYIDHFLFVGEVPLESDSDPRKYWEVNHLLSPVTINVRDSRLYLETNHMGTVTASGKDAVLHINSSRSGGFCLEDGATAYVTDPNAFSEYITDKLSIKGEETLLFFPAWFNDASDYRNGRYKGVSPYLQHPESDLQKVFVLGKELPKPETLENFEQAEKSGEGQSCPVKCGKVTVLVCRSTNSRGENAFAVFERRRIRKTQNYVEKVDDKLVLLDGARSLSQLKVKLSKHLGLPLDSFALPENKLKGESVTASASSLKKIVEAEKKAEETFSGQVEVFLQKETAVEETGLPRWMKETPQKIVIDKLINSGNDSVYLAKAVYPDGEVTVAVKTANFGKEKKEGLKAIREAGVVQRLRKEFTRLFPGEDVPLIYYRAFNIDGASQVLVEDPQRILSGEDSFPDHYQKTGVMEYLPLSDPNWVAIGRDLLFEDGCKIENKIEIYDKAAVAVLRVVVAMNSLGISNKDIKWDSSIFVNAQTGRVVILDWDIVSDIPYSPYFLKEHLFPYLELGVGITGFPVLKTAMYDRLLQGRMPVWDALRNFSASFKDYKLPEGFDAYCLAVAEDLASGKRVEEILREVSDVIKSGRFAEEQN